MDSYEKDREDNAVREQDYLMEQEALRIIDAEIQSIEAELVRIRIAARYNTGFFMDALKRNKVI